MLIKARIRGFKMIETIESKGRARRQNRKKKKVQIIKANEMFEGRQIMLVANLV